MRRPDGIAGGSSSVATPMLVRQLAERKSPPSAKYSRMRRRSGPMRKNIGTTSSTASACVHRSCRHHDVNAVAESVALGRRSRNAATDFTKKARCDDIGVSARTVGELRKVTAWPENLVITTPQERHPDSA